ncbi:hypothetical protein THMIRHAS_13300 [Thiosulfatimonas sediminis]|uniref:Uncharacterized protein n=1 Tax=Thiosulfatimonas sediminis TaxID=2675054 RepID=A0A6F8PV92_9GAMM|nr:hypothetical protein [Thiosulfatimonas sediminis]BBP45957.1 hypothetical protein THMIRHAS_13300 [Thiosulfatimonas sediminis]
MKFFKDHHNEIYVISDAQMHLVRPDWIEITEKQREALLSQQDHADLEPEVLTEQQISAIKERLLEIDVESIRPLRAIATDTAQYYDHQKLKTLNQERVQLLRLLKNK